MQAFLWFCGRGASRPRVSAPSWRHAGVVYGQHINLGRGGRQSSARLPRWILLPRGVIAQFQDCQGGDDVPFGFPTLEGKTTYVLRTALSLTGVNWLPVVKRS